MYMYQVSVRRGMMFRSTLHTFTLIKSHSLQLNTRFLNIQSLLNDFYYKRAYNRV